MTGKGRGRPGGNPDFGTKFRFDYGNLEKRDQVLALRFTARELEAIKALGGDKYRDFCRKAVLDALEASAKPVN